MQHPKVTDAEIVQLVLDGWSGVAIAEKYGFTDATVVYRVKRATGLKPSQLRQQNGWAASNVPPDEVSKILALYEQKESVSPDKPYVRPTLASVARETGHAPETIKNILRSENVEIGGEGHRSFFSDSQKNEIVELYTNGTSCPQLAKRFGVNEITIRRALKSRGIPRRPRGRPPVEHETPLTTS